MSLYLLPETPEHFSGNTVNQSHLTITSDFPEPVGQAYERYIKIYHKVEEFLDEEESDEEDDQVKAVKKRDLTKEIIEENYYALLGLEELTWKATPEEIKKAYKQMVLIHHPDKQGGDETAFKMINQAYETLGDPTSRAAYDSMQPFDDSIPSVSEVTANFFTVLPEVFERNQKFSTKPLPQFGDDSTDINDVYKFYEAWFAFSSWRNFSFLDEYDPEEADSREERRWMERKNTAKRSKKVKEEKARISKLVNMAYQIDPRIIRHKEEERVKRYEAKKARAEEQQKRKEENERKRIEMREQREAAEEARLQQIMQEQEAEEEEKRQILQAKRDKLRLFCTKFEYDHDKAEYIIEDLEFDQFIKLFKSFKGKKKNQVFEILDATYNECVANHDNLKKSEGWTSDELALLAKAVIRYPGGTKGRWERISDMLGGSKSVDSIIDKVKNATRIKKTPSDKLSQQYSQSSSAGIVVDVQVDDDVASWSTSEQSALEEALKKYPASQGKSRWDSIASEIPGRSKKDCVLRYKYLVEIIKKSRE